MSENMSNASCKLREHQKCQIAYTRFKIGVIGQAVRRKIELFCRPSFHLLYKIPLCHPVKINKKKRSTVRITTSYLSDVTLNNSIFKLTLILWELRLPQRFTRISLGCFVLGFFFNPELVKFQSPARSHYFRLQRLHRLP